jgi:hypothetical protein
VDLGVPGELPDLREGPDALTLVGRIGEPIREVEHPHDERERIRIAPAA